VVHYSRFQDKDSGIVYTTSKASADKYPSKENFIRIRSFDSSYKLTPIEGGIIEIEYYMRVDPGGILPNWLINLAVTKGPINTIKSLFELIETQKYRDSQVSNIIE